MPLSLLQSCYWGFSFLQSGLRGGLVSFSFLKGFFSHIYGYSCCQSLDGMHGEALFFLLLLLLYTFRALSLLRDCACIGGGLQAH